MTAHKISGISRQPGSLERVAEAWSWVDELALPRAEQAPRPLVHVIAAALDSAQAPSGGSRRRLL